MNMAGERGRERDNILSKHFQSQTVLHKSKSCTLNLSFPAGGELVTRDVTASKDFKIEP